MPSQKPTCQQTGFLDWSRYHYCILPALAALTLSTSTPVTAQGPSKGAPGAAKSNENQDKQALIKKIMSGEDYKNTILRFDYKKHQVSLKDMDKYWDKKNVYILDLRSAEQYKSGHIKGALHLGADILEDKLVKLVPDKKATIIVYCNNSLFPTRMLALTDTCLPQFSALGYENVYSLSPIWHDSPNYNHSFMEGPHWINGTVGK